MAAWFSSKKSGQEKKPGEPDVNASASGGVQHLTITEGATNKLIELMSNAQSPVLGIRIVAEATSPMNPQYSLAFVQEGDDLSDDTVFEYQEFKVYIDSESMPYMENVRLDFISTHAGQGFRIDRVSQAPELEGPLAEKVQKVIDEQINPALALHGGYVQLLEVKDDTAYVELGGGCKGCGMVDVTLKQGIEVMIKQAVPEIKNILDSTDHAHGQNPYYQPAK